VCVSVSNSPVLASPSARVAYLLQQLHHWSGQPRAAAGGPPSPSLLIARDWSHVSWPPPMRTALKLDALSKQRWPALAAAANPHRWPAPWLQGAVECGECLGGAAPDAAPAPHARTPSTPNQPAPAAWKAAGARCDKPHPFLGRPAFLNIPNSLWCCWYQGWGSCSVVPRNTGGQGKDTFKPVPAVELSRTRVCDSVRLPTCPPSSLLAMWQRLASCF
jgi:hypothetical protein